MISHTITDRDAGSRFNKFLERLLPNANSGFLYKMLRKKNITLNGKKAEGRETLEAGDTVEIFFSDETYAAFRKAESTEPVSYSAHPIKESDIVYRDDSVLIACKPAGILSQKDTPESESFNEMVLQYLLNEGIVNPASFREYKPGICNRLDRNTAGLVIFGLTLPAGRELNRLLKERKIGKYYYAVVLGEMKRPIDSRLFLTKDSAANQVSITEQKQNEESVSVHTEIIPVCSGKELSLVRVILHTGKSHQIRSVLSYLRHPVLGDPKYISSDSPFASLNQKYRVRYHLHAQMLLAYALRFPEGLSGEVEKVSGKIFYAPLPKPFAEVITSEFTKGADPDAVMEIPGTPGIVL